MTSVFVCLVIVAGLGQAPPTKVAHELLRDAMDAGKVDAAATLLKSALQAEKNLAVKKQLREEYLLALHRKNEPNDPHLRLFDAELAFLKGEYAAALPLYLGMDREHARRFGRRGGDRDQRDKAIVCLVRLKRFEEALKLAEEWIANSPPSDPVGIALAYASVGDVGTVRRIMKHHAEYHLDAFYRDEDLGPLLRLDAFREIRETFPEPKKQK